MAAIGDVVTIIPTLVANNLTLDIKPLSGMWTIHNLSYGGAMELYKTDGTNSIKVQSDPSGGGCLSYMLHCTPISWYQLKNVSGASAYMSYDGKQVV